MSVYEVSETRYTLSVREFYDSDSPSKRGWDIESYDSNVTHRVCSGLSVRLSLELPARLKQNSAIASL